MGAKDAPVELLRAAEPALEVEGPNPENTTSETVLSGAAGRMAIAADGEV